MSFSHFFGAPKISRYIHIIPRLLLAMHHDLVRNVQGGHKKLLAYTPAKKSVHQCELPARVCRPLAQTTLLLNRLVQEYPFAPVILGPVLPVQLLSLSFCEVLVALVDARRTVNRLDLSLFHLYCTIVHVRLARVSHSLPTSLRPTLHQQLILILSDGAERVRDFVDDFVTVPEAFLNINHVLELVLSVGQQTFRELATLLADVHLE